MNTKRTLIVGVPSAIFILLLVNLYTLRREGGSSGFSIDLSPSRLFSETHYDDSPLELTGGKLGPEAFDFTPVKPQWLSAPIPEGYPKPLRLRMGIISAPNEFERRKAFRQYILRGARSDEVVLDYRFILGYSSEDSPAYEDRLVLEEQLIHRDILRLDMRDNRLRLGEKRWRMLKWASEAHNSTYDYYLSADTDAFFRIAALARRIPHIAPEIRNPMEQDVIIGRMGGHKVHFVPNPYDNETTAMEEDEQIFENFPGEEWYSYPLGYGFLISSHLVSRLAAPSMSLPHHVHFPADDVMVGQWVADFAADAHMIDDRAGFHDALNHSWFEDHTKIIDYDSVCVHHVKPNEIKFLRSKEEWVNEWVSS